ncbi:MAG: hypothetical protein H0V17_35070, partial [Deltaproteobacteria bacterium]|nr:hypothetical protein [Deltaproteobacteria bacterium]
MRALALVEILRALALVLALASCLSSGVGTCADGKICPADSQCKELAVWAPDGTRPQSLCVPDDDLVECANRDDLEACTAVAGMGACHEGACVAFGCGNFFQDPDEACDDGNIQLGDGCSFACRSDETCGNGFVDPVTQVGDDDGDPIFEPRERCDDFNISPNDGCSAQCVPELPRWSERKPRTVPDRASPAMAYDAHRGVFVMFGGFKPDSTNEIGFADTWIGSIADCLPDHCIAWSESPVSNRPSERRSHAMTFDEARGRVVLFGGQLGPELFDDTWEWDGRAWTQVSIGAGPPSRSRFAMTYDAARRRTVLFGGQNKSGQLDDTWEWDGETWTL